MIEPQACIPRAIELLPAGAESFYDLRHQGIFGCMAAMWDRRQPGDLIAVAEALKTAGKLEECGGHAYLSSLPACTPSPANLDYWAGIVLEKYLGRRMLRVCIEAAAKIYDGTGDTVTDILDGIERDVLAVRNERSSDGEETPIRSLVTEAINSIEDRRNRGDALIGLSTGLRDLDRATSGLIAGDLTVIAAYPSVGKTSLAMNLAEHVALELRLPVGVFSFEMTAASLVERMLASRARVNLRKAGDWVQGDFDALGRASIAIGASNLHVISRPMSIARARAKARRMWSQHGIKLFIFDYIQLIECGVGRGGNREQEISAVTLGLMQLSKETGCHVITMSQLNDDGKLRESRAIGQHADNVWVLTEKTADETADEPPTVREVDLVIKKQRNGARGFKIPLIFHSEFTRFADAARVPPDETPKPRKRHND